MRGGNRPFRQTGPSQLPSTLRHESLSLLLLTGTSTCVTQPPELPRSCEGEAIAAHQCRAPVTGEVGPDVAFGKWVSLPVHASHVGCHSGISAQRCTGNLWKVLALPIKAMYCLMIKLFQDVRQ